VLTDFVPRARRRLGIACMAAGLLVVAACAPGQIRQETPSVLDALARLEGTIQLDSATGQYVLPHRARMETILASVDVDSIAAVLVAHMSDAEPSNVTLNGRRVPRGMIYYEALSQLVCYEPTTSGGGSDSSWAGHIEPTATPAQMDRAQKAWAEVVRTHAYSRL
jgi:hypothetical protein